MTEEKRPKPRYHEEYDLTYWEYDDHYLAVKGKVEEVHEAGLFPMYIIKTKRYGIDQIFKRHLESADIEVEVDGLSVEDVTPESRYQEPDEPTESMY